MDRQTDGQTDPMETPLPHGTGGGSAHTESPETPPSSAEGPRASGDVVLYPNTDPKPRCTAKSKQSGDRCKRAATPGTHVCRNHGSASPQVQAKIARNLMELHDPLIKATLEIIEDRSAPVAVRAKLIDSTFDRIGYPKQKEVVIDDVRRRLAERLEQAAGEIEVEVIDTTREPPALEQ